MPGGNFKKLNGATENDLDRIQDNIGNAFLGLQTILTGAVTVETTLSTTMRSIPHTLGRPYQGYLVIQRDAGETVFNGESTQPSRFLRMQATGTVKVTLLVF